MPAFAGKGTSLVVAAALVALARAASADVTIVGRYTFVNGDTTTRASYFSTRRIRVSTPDGREVVFDSKTQRLTLIDPARKVYWMGPLASADSIVDVIDGSRWQALLRHADGEVKAEWARDMQFPPDSVVVRNPFGTRTIAGYPCNLWTIRAGSLMHGEHWVAYALDTDDFEQNMQDVMLAAFRDPVARCLMAMYWDSRATDGLPLESTVTFDSPTQRGTFHWQAVAVSDQRIPESAWAPPPGCTPVQLAGEVAEE